MRRGGVQGMGNDGERKKSGGLFIYIIVASGRKAIGRYLFGIFLDILLLFRLLRAAFLPSK